ncbi:MFS transporter [Cupriavidus sp. UME77]|uniref:MFS transporter n=1 Tax=Cupriavidus sp. UME77 TaxID=1862321 RepID=UPI001602B6FF|nr:MFS transporter [Cupriavidus sp. UME77]MBB1630073.1 MFS transporter [Cupriavidus sp. UME77]
MNIFPGWYVVGATHVLLALIFGAAYSFGAFFASIQEGFGVGSSSAASVFSFTALIYYVVGVFSGSLADRISTRRVIAMGIVSLALGFAIASIVTDSLAGFLVAFCSLVGLGVGLVYVPAVTAVQRWFVRHRSRASGLALAGTGLGTFIGPVVAGLLMEHMSWQATMRCFALAIAVVGLAMATLLKGRPEEAGLYPDGAPAAPGAAHLPPPTGLSLAQAVRGGRFWWYFGAILLGSVGLFAALVHIHPYARQHGLSSTAGNLLIGLVGAGNILGRLLLGGLGDRLGPGRLLMCLTLMLALLNGVWLEATSFPALALFAVLFGAANGGCISLYPALAATWFGTANLGAILGALYVAVGIAAMAGGSLAGWLFDAYGSYSVAIAVSAGCALLSTACIARASRHEKSGPDRAA